MKLEAVGAISMRNLIFQIGGQIDDGDGIEWTFFGTYSATDAETFGDEGKAGLGGDFNAKFTASDDGA